MRVFDGNTYRDMTEEEAANLTAQTRQATIAARRRPLTQEEVSRMLIAGSINTLDVDDNTALRMKDFYPQWAEGTVYEAGFKVRYGGKLWRVRQAHTAQVGWEPEHAAALWEQLNESYAGTIDDPIPYEGNMALESGKYYIQSDTIYLCDRDTMNPVYQPLKELEGLYVKEV